LNEAFVYTFIPYCYKKVHLAVEDQIFKNVHIGTLMTFFVNECLLIVCVSNQARNETIMTLKTNSLEKGRQ